VPRLPLGDRRSTLSSKESAALATIGVVAETLLDNALAHEEAQQLDMLKSEFIALGAAGRRAPVSGSRSHRRMPEPTEATSSTSRWCRTAPDSSW
jgi:hypothetical protein